MRQYFISQKLTLGQSIVLDDQQAHHVRDVLRMRNGDLIRLVDGEGNCYMASLAITAAEVTATAEKEAGNNGSERKIICCAALIKKDKWELLLQKGAELGADVIVPLVTNRTVIHLEEKDVSKKLDRWNKITLEACQQSNRTSLCEVTAPVKLKDIGKYMGDVNLVAYEKEDGLMLAETLSDGDICFVIGPEGGLEEKEVELLESLGFASVSLGRRILRAETAAMFVLSVIEALG